MSQPLPHGARGQAATSMIGPLPELEPFVSELRFRHDPWARRGVPAHVTLLGPFVPAREVSKATLGQLASMCAERQAIGVRFTRAVKLSGTVCLVPEHRDELVRLSADLADTFPAASGARTPPTRHHVTVARCDEDEAESIHARLLPLLPLSGAITELQLLATCPG